MLKDCYTCGVLREDFSMSTHRLKAGGPVVGMVCADCANEERDTVKGYRCNTCRETFTHKDEVVFDGDELKTVDERNPDWHHCTCITCFYPQPGL